MKKSASLIALAAAAIGFIAGYVLKPAPHSNVNAQSENFFLVPAALAQEKKPEVMPFNYNSPREPALAPDAPPTMYWSVDDLRKAHSELAEVAAKAMKEAGTGSSQSFGGGPIHVSSRNFSIFQLYRLHREQPVASGAFELLAPEQDVGQPQVRPGGPSPGRSSPAPRGASRAAGDP